MLGRRWWRTLLLAGTLAAVGPTAVAAADVAPYGTNDAGGFLNVLPPGEAGTDNALQFGQFTTSGQRPAHWDDQQSLYQNLPYASPNLTHAQIGQYFKDATFGVPAGQVASTESPRSDVTITRDQGYGVPHIYGTDRGGVMFGAGYAGAEDRLFLMDVLRHTGRAQLSSFVGGSAGNRNMDRTQWAIAPYTEGDLQSQIDNAPRLYGQPGAQSVQDVTDYVAGINAYVDAANLNPNLKPFEYSAINQPMTRWTATDVVAIASLVGGIFGKGGGNELRSALTEQAFEARFGAAAGRRAWADFRSKDDPESPLTVRGRFPYETTSAFATRGLAMPDPGSVSFTPPAPPVDAPRAAPRAAAARPSDPLGADGSLGTALLRAARTHSDSNWEMVAARHSANGHAIAVMGPQVGYYVPQILMEEDLHGPGIDARGAAFPGVNLVVQLGHGRDYAWSATTANSDNVDTFAEVLCSDDVHYLYKGQCLPMERLDRANAWTPNLTDSSPAGSETLTAYRTVHGIVYARGKVGGKPVAFVSARTTYFHEADSVIGFSQLNDPGFVTSPASFQRAVSNILFGFNWGYADANHIAYYHSGYYPQRSPGTSPDFPILGTGEYDWQGYDPAQHTIDALPFAAHPNAIDPDYLVSWNNKQAPGWSAADDRYAYSSVFRSQLIENFVRRGIANGAKMRTEQLVSAMDEPATQDLRIVALWPTLKRMLGSPTDPRLAAAMNTLQAWYDDGGHRRDLTRSGHDQHEAAIALMDAWWPRLLAAEFGPALGPEAMTRLQTMIPFGSSEVTATPAAPDFEQGWYGYVSKDLRDLLSVPARTATHCRTVRRRVRRHHRVVTIRVRRCATVAVPSTATAARALRRTRPHRPRAGSSVLGPWSRVYCGGGSLAACRAALRSTLLDATPVTPAQLYGSGDCAGNPDSACFDQNRSTVTSGIGEPPFPFQNRPTFQQVVELTRTLPR